MDTIAARPSTRRGLASRLWRGYRAWRLELERARYATTLAELPRRRQRALRELYANDNFGERMPTRVRRPLVRVTARPVSSLVSVSIAVGAVLIVVVVLTS